MYRQRIQQNVLLIDSLIELNAHPQQTISLFYSTVKMIQKMHAQQTKQLSVNRGCFQPVDSISEIEKIGWKVQELFMYFLQRNSQLHSQLDKINSHTLQITTQIIAHINQIKISELYKNQLGNNNEQSNKQEKGKNQSSFSKFQHLFTESENDICKSKKETISQTQKSQSKTINVNNINKPTNSLQSDNKHNENRTILNQIEKDTYVKTHQNKPQSSSTNSHQLNVKTVLKLYQQHKIDQAHQLLILIEKHQPQLIQAYHQHNSQLDQLISQIKQECNQMMFFYQHFDLTGYQIDKTEDSVVMHYKIIDKQNLVAIQVKSQVDLSLEKFLCIASQIELYDKYVPFNYQTTCLKQPARNKKIGRSKVFIPLLNNRQAYFEAKAYDRLQKQNCIFMFSKNLKKQHLAALNIEYKSQGLVDLDYIFFLLSYTPISKEQGVVKMATCIDLKISILPKFILNKTARIFAFDYFKNMININKKFENSAWEKAILSKPEHYNFFKQKTDEYFKSKISKNQQST